MSAYQINIYLSNGGGAEETKTLKKTTFPMEKMCHHFTKNVSLSLNFAFDFHSRTSAFFI